MNLGSVLLRCWPEVLLCADVVRVGNDIKRASLLALLRQLTSALFSTAPARLCEWDSHRLALTYRNLKVEVKSIKDH